MCKKGTIEIQKKCIDVQVRKSCAAINFELLYSDNTGNWSLKELHCGQKASLTSHNLMKVHC